MDMELSILPESNVDLWNRILASSDHATIFHTWKWLKIAERYSGSRFIPLVGMRGTEPVGLIPLFVQRSFLQTMVFSPPPHLAIPFLGPVFANYRQLKMHKKESIYLEFQKKLDDYLQDELKASYCSIILPPGLADPRPFTWAGYEVRPVYDYSIPLDDHPDRIWDSLGKKLRLDISRGEKKGYVVEEGGDDELQLIYELMVQRYQQQKRVVKVPKEYLIELFDTFKQEGNIKVFVAKYEGRILTGWIDILYNKELISWIGNLRPLEKISPSPNDLSCWYGIRFAIDRGIHHYITAEAAGNPRLHEYYAKFNPDLRVRYAVKRSSRVSKTLESTYTGVVKPTLDWIGSGRG